jgi:sulfopyruvate decarboxylase subunit alpha
MFQPMFTGEQIASLLTELGVTHVVTIPDSTIGQWYGALEGEKRLRLVRVCREGEAWGVAGGLHLGGAAPLVMIQCTGLFESGDALRNVVHDWKLPIPSIIGYRSYLNQDTLPGDTCLTFTEPVLDAWKIDYCLITKPSQLQEMRDHLAESRSRGVARAALIAEGKA